MTISALHIILEQAHRLRDQISAWTHELKVLSEAKTRIEELEARVKLGTEHFEQLLASVPTRIIEHFREGNDANTSIVKNANDEPTQAEQKAKAEAESAAAVKAQAINILKQASEGSKS